MSKLTIDPKTRFCNIDKFADYICRHIGLSEVQLKSMILTVDGSSMKLK